jgi:phage terminase large subunit
MTPYEAWLHSRDNPLLFVTHVLGAEPMPWQVEALNLIATEDRVAIRAAHDQGKTAFLAWVGLWFLTTRIPCRIPVIANSLDQLRDVTWAELGKWGRKLPDALRDKFEFGAERIFLKGSPDECFAVARTASKSNPEALQGFHSENLLFLIEEASGIEDIVFEVGSGALSSKGSKALMIANPTRSSGYFAKAFKENRWLWKGLAWPWRKTPYNDERYPAQMAREYGEQSNVYRVRVLGEFPLSDDNAVIPLDIVESAVERQVDVTAGRSTVWGLDVGAGGDDSALAKRKGNWLLEPVDRWNYADPNQTTGRVARAYFETPEGQRPLAINVDTIGVGASVAGRLRELGLPAFGINWGEANTSMDDPARFVRLKDELWWKGRDWFFARDCRIPNDPSFIGEIVVPTYKEQSNGKILIESNDELKKRGVRSPNRASAFLLTFAGGEFAGAIAYRSHGDDGGYDPLDMDRSYRRGGRQDYAINDWEGI